MAHIPVLLKESLEGLDLHSGENVIDCTLGSGGHTKAILESVAPDGKVLGIDMDEDAIERVKERLPSDMLSRVVFHQGNFADVHEIVQEVSFPRANALIADLGFSSNQLEESGRGFSFQEDEPLMMNYDKETQVKAAHLINMLSQRELADMIYEYSGERYARRIAKNIVKARKKDRIITVGDLNEIIKNSVPNNYERGRIHPSTRTFQALRITVNDELENLKKLLKAVRKVLVPGGRVVIISFHSLEDRIVKHFFKEKEESGSFEIITKKPVTASREEVRENPRSRSAKLRVAKVKSGNNN